MRGHDATTLLAFEDITDRRAVEEKVQELLREKDMLLQEMQHRVANSLQGTSKNSRSFVFVQVCCLTA